VGQGVVFQVINWIPFTAQLPSFLFGVTLGTVFAHRHGSRLLDPAQLTPVGLLAARSLASAALVALHAAVPPPTNLFAHSWASHGLLLPLQGLWIYLVAEPRRHRFDLIQTALRSRPLRDLSKMTFPILVIHTAVLRNLADWSFSMCANSSRLTFCSPAFVKQLNFSYFVYGLAVLSAAAILFFLVEQPGRRWIFNCWQDRVQGYVNFSEPLGPNTLSPTTRKAMFYAVMLAFLFGFFGLASGGWLRLLSRPFFNFQQTGILAALTAIPMAMSLVTLSINLVSHVLFPSSILKTQQARSSGNTALPVKRTRTVVEELGAPALTFDHCIYFRFVTRGNNPELVARNTKEAWSVLHDCLPERHFQLEVVTDEPMALAQGSPFPVAEILVPDDYQTRNGARFKARALEYAVHQSAATADDWIVHLDEETRFDRVTVREILRHITENNQDKAHSVVGQGPVIYGCPPADGSVVNWFTTLGDSFRVADDFGKFRLQYHFGEAWLGMHGSFVVCPNRLEQSIGFDHGLAGSITEDAYFALLASAQGAKFKWINAFMYEQSPFTIPDVVKQRSRWFGGLLMVCLSEAIPWRKRVILCFATLSWLCLPINWIGTMYLMLSGSLALSSGFFVVMLCGSWTMVTWCYVLGFVKTYCVQDGLARYLFLLWLQLVLQPMHGIIEAVSVLYALVYVGTVTRSFHVVEKEVVAESREEEADAGQRSRVGRLSCEAREVGGGSVYV